MENKITLGAIQIQFRIELVMFKRTLPGVGNIKMSYQTKTLFNHKTSFQCLFPQNVLKMLVPWPLSKQSSIQDSPVIHDLSDNLFSNTLGSPDQYLLLLHWL